MPSHAELLQIQNCACILIAEQGALTAPPDPRRNDQRRIDGRFI